MTTPLLTMTIPQMRATSINRWSRMHWAERKRHRSDVFMLIRSSLPWDVVNCNGWPAQSPVRLRITATMKPPLLDADNVTLKDIVDSLCGWVVFDDDARYVTEVTPVVRRGREDKIVVEVLPDG